MQGDHTVIFERHIVIAMCNLAVKLFARVKFDHQMIQLFWVHHDTHNICFSTIHIPTCELR